MNAAMRFFKKNFKIIAISCIAILFVLLTAFGGISLAPKNATIGSADINTYWSDNVEAFSTRDDDGNALGLSATSPILINSAGQLAYLSSQINSGSITEFRYYKLTKGIDLSAHCWVPIGTGKYFSGQIDCNNKPIIGMNVNGTYDQAGLFGTVDNLIIMNAIITDANINITSEKGSAGIIAGTINNGTGKLQIINSSIRGSISTLSYPSKTDGVGGVVGAVRNCVKSDSMFENVYVNVKISVPNRENNSCSGALIGCSSISDFNLINIVSESQIGSSSLKLYYGTFGAADVSTWFYNSELNGGVPAIKSQYWIGNNVDFTGTQITEQLKAKGFAQSTIIGLIPEVKVYVISTEIATINNSTRTGFKVYTQTQTGSPNAVAGEKVTVTTKTIEGYKFSKFTANGKGFTTSSFIMPDGDCTVIATFIPIIYKITLSANGGSVSPTYKNVAYDSIPSSFPKPTRSGYTFDGWLGQYDRKVVDQNGDIIPSTIYTDSTGRWTYANSITLRAKWAENKSYLLSTWQTKVAEGIGTTIDSFSKYIKTITFTKTKPSTGKTVLVGAESEGTESVNSQVALNGRLSNLEVTAYVTGDSTSGYKVTFYSPYKIYAPMNSSYLFSNRTDSYKLRSLTNITFGSLDASKVKTMERMFSDAESLTSLDLSGIDASQVTKTVYMFDSCFSLRTINFTNFKTTSLTSATGMFANCTGMIKLDLKSFTTTNVTEMVSMFFNCTSLEELNLSSFNMKNTTSFGTMLRSCDALKSVQTPLYAKSAISIPALYDSKLVSYSEIPANSATSLDLRKKYTVTLEPNGGTLNTTKITVRHNSTYGEITSLGDPYKSGKIFAGWFTANTGGTKVTNITQLVSNSDHTIYARWTEGSSYLPNNWKDTVISNTDYVYNYQNPDTGEVSYTTKNMAKTITFTAVQPERGTVITVSTSGDYPIRAYITGDTNLGFDVVVYSQATIYAPSDSSELFKGFEVVKKIDLQNFDTSKAETFEEMFAGLTQLETLTVTRWDTSSVTTMKNMFYDCNSLTKLAMDCDTSHVTDMSYMFANCFALSKLGIYNFVTDNVTDMSYMFSACKSLTILQINNFNTTYVENMSNMFENCSALTSLDLSSFDTYHVNNMEYMFYNCASLSELDATMLKTSNVTNMRSMFALCSGLTKLDVSPFDTYYVTDMSGMFSGCTNVVSIDVSGFKTGNVKSMQSMFDGCAAVQGLDLKYFDTASVTDMRYMFRDCSSLFDLDISSFKTTNVTNMAFMFSGCSNLSYLDVTSFDTSAVTSMIGMFERMPVLKSLNLKSFVIKACCSTDRMIDGTTGKLVEIITPEIQEKVTIAIEGPTYGEWLNGNGEKVTSIRSDIAVGSVISLKSATTFEMDWSNINWSSLGNGMTKANEITGLRFAKEGNASYTRSTVTYNYMEIWYGNSSATKNDIMFVFPGTIYSSDGYSYEGLFTGLTNLSSVEFDNFDTSKMTSMELMFKGCENLGKADLTGFDTSNVKNMSSMFEGCYSLYDVNLKSFKTTKVTTMKSMFKDCKSLEYADLASFVAPNVTDVSYMFAGCSSLTSAYLRNFRASLVTNMKYMFKGCSSLKEINLSAFSLYQEDIMWGATTGIFEGCTSLDPSNIVSWNVIDNYEW